MKKLILALALATAATTGANAQVTLGSSAPDFNLTDINGQPQHLYSYLDSGYTVIIDVSAAWCGPCWAAHTSHVFDDLMTHYGPSGTITPKKVMVLFIEGESTNTTAQLHGTSSGSSYATFSQGDWVTGTNYPIIDNASQNGNYLYGGYPSFTVIGRDRIVYYTGAGYGSSMNESYWLNYVNMAPNYPPSTTVDAKAVPYSGQDFYICNATPTVKFQNYSTSNTITSATINVKNGSTTVKSQPWTGSLAPFAVASVAIPSFSANSGNYTFEVKVTNDSKPTNDASTAFPLMIYSAASAATSPWNENFESTSNGALPSTMRTTDADNVFTFKTNGTYTVTGVTGSTTTAVAVQYQGMATGGTAELLIGNYNTASATNVALDFDWAHASVNGSNDKLEVKVSNDCGATWNTAWSASGTALATHADVTGIFIPGAVGDWQHITVPLTSKKGNNMIVKFVATSQKGQYGWLDNLKITNTTGVANVINTNSVNLYPNPTADVANLEFSLAQNSKVTVSVMDAMGRTVSVLADGYMNQGAQKIQIPTANLAAGVYNISIRTEQGNLTQRLSVVK
ncbi:MAG: T9SS type A sorting domain-containing protein [Bacteroidetes bacterium]|nr:T9SS type A sorting domain-containing protein [Bacteroidota bacterium]